QLAAAGAGCCASERPASTTTTAPARRTCLALMRLPEARCRRRHELDHHIPARNRIAGERRVDAAALDALLECEAEGEIVCNATIDLRRQSVDSCPQLSVRTLKVSWRHPAL